MKENELAANLSGCCAALLCEHLIKENDRYWCLVGIQTEKVNETCVSVVFDYTATMFTNGNDEARVLWMVEGARIRAKSFVAGQLSLAQTFNHLDYVLSRHPSCIEKGDKIEICCQGLIKTGVVVSANNYGRDGNEDWYIEMWNKTELSIYWKQGIDGGYARVIEPL